MALQCLSCGSPVARDYRACPKCGKPISEFAMRHQEEPIDGKYRIVSMLGAGGMGEVYKVEHIHLHSFRVIKLMRPDVAARQEGHERFAREARLATRIQHPNVATLHDFAMLSDGSFYMVWEFIEGTTLTDVIRKVGRLSPRYAAEISIEALEGLDAIHRAGIVHRDISPDNVMITIDDSGHQRVKIIDLGIAKPTDDDLLNQQTKTGMFVGKWKYGSPEHFGFLRAGEKIDGRADIYGWGIVMYEMLSGSPPFISETPQSYIMKHAQESPQPLRVVSPAIEDAPELEALIFCALEKDRTNRFQTAREFAVALRKLLPRLHADRTGTASATRTQDLDMTKLLADTAPDTTAPAPAEVTRRAVMRESTRSVAPTSVRELPQALGTVHAPRPAPPVEASIATAKAPPPAPTATPPPVATPVPVAAPNVTPIEPPVPASFHAPGEPAPRQTSRWLRPLLLALGAAILLAVAFMVGRRSSSTPTDVVSGTAQSAPVVAPAVVEAIAPATGSTSSDVPASSTVIVEEARTEVPEAATQTKPTEPLRRDPKPIESRDAKRPPQAVTQPEVRPAGGGQTQQPVLAPGQKGKRFVNSPEYKSGIASAIIRHYDVLTEGDAVHWSWVAPNVRLADSKITLRPVRNLTSVSSERMMSWLQNDLQTALDELTAEHTGSLVITTESAIYWAEDARSRKRGIAVEMVFRDSTGRIVAMLRHREYENSPEDAAEEVVEAVVGFVEEN